MITGILKRIYFKLPGNLRMLIVNMFYLVKLNKIYKRFNSPDYFPVNYVENIDLPIFENSNKEGYFYRYYQEKEDIHHLSPEDLFKYKYEIIYGKYYVNEIFKFQCKETSVLPISIENHEDVLKITCNDKLTDEIKNLSSARVKTILLYGTPIKL